MRKRLDLEMRPYRQAAKYKNPTHGLLRAIRHALDIPVAELVKELGINQSSLFALEARELEGTITLESISRVSRAMGCRVIYGIVPCEGETIETLLERRYWAELLGVPLRTVAEKNAAIRKMLKE